MVKDGGSTATYTYNALGQRVYGLVGGTTNYYYQYDPLGNPLYAPISNGDELTEPVAGRVLASSANSIIPCLA